MLEVKGFRGVRFAAGRVGSLSCVVTPPYDVITPEDRARLVQSSPYSMAHVILPEPAPEYPGLTPYEAAGRRFNAWLEAGVLKQDDAPSLYLLRQEFQDAQGAWRVRHGFFAVARIPEPGDDTVLGHERIFDDTVDDRLLLTEATQANLGPVFVLYDDPDDTLGALFRGHYAQAPDLAVETIDGVRQQLWRIPHEPRVTDFLRGRRLYIADGHHRFHTACVYRDRMRALHPEAGPRPFDYVLMGFVRFTDPGLLVYPTHRLMAAPAQFDNGLLHTALEGWFEMEPARGVPPERLTEALEAETGCTIGAVTPKGQYLLRLREPRRDELLGGDRGPAWRALDVAVFHRGIVDRLLGLGDRVKFAYERDAAQAVQAVREGRYSLAFLFKAPHAEQVRACAEAGESMPHKSTYFFPKLPTGAVIHRLAE